jgi:hypothetical protein
MEFTCVRVVVWVSAKENEYLSDFSFSTSLTFLSHPRFRRLRSPSLHGRRMKTQDERHICTSRPARLSYTALTAGAVVGAGTALCAAGSSCNSGCHVTFMSDVEVHPLAISLYLSPSTCLGRDLPNTLQRSSVQSLLFPCHPFPCSPSQNSLPGPIPHQLIGLSRQPSTGGTELN